MEGICPRMYREGEASRPGLSYGWLNQAPLGEVGADAASSAAWGGLVPRDPDLGVLLKGGKAAFGTTALKEDSDQNERSRLFPNWWRRPDGTVVLGNIIQP